MQWWKPLSSPYKSVTTEPHARSEARKANIMEDVSSLKKRKTVKHHGLEMLLGVPKNLMKSMKKESA